MTRITDQVFARVVGPLTAEQTRMYFELRSHTDDRAGAIEARLDRLEGMLEGRLHRIDAAIERLEKDAEGLGGHLPYLLMRLGQSNTAARESRRRLDALAGEVGALREIVGRQDGDIAAARTRTEFVRREFMHELRHGGRSRGAAAELPVEIRDESLIVEDDRVTGSATGTLRLNLGAGHIALDGYVNTDIRPLDGIGIVGDVADLPVAPGVVDEIRSSHLMEHFPREQLRRSVLPHWRDLLRPGGSLVAIVPDAEEMLAEHAAGRYSFDDLRLVTFGEQEYDGDFHFTMFSRADMVEMLREAGFEDVRVVEAGRRNGVAYEMEVHARAPEQPGTPPPPG